MSLGFSFAWYSAKVKYAFLELFRYMWGKPHQLKSGNQHQSLVYAPLPRGIADSDRPGMALRMGEQYP
jgi:hypothetical protein